MFKRIMAGCLLLVCLFSPAFTESSAVEKKLNDVFRRYDTLGACVVVIRNGEIAYVHTYGEERIAGNAVSEDTLFQVGSISKMIANIALMQLLEEKGIGLDTELGDVLGYPVRNPAFPNTPITLRQLMSHTASLRDSGYYDRAIAGEVLPLSTMFDASHVENAFFLGCEPGMQRVYSNMGGGLIACLVEKLSGETFDGYIRRNVFEPLGITAAYQRALLGDELPMASLYHMPDRQIAKDLRVYDPAYEQADPEMHYTLTAGKLIISATDLAKLLIALCDGGMYRDVRILRESTVAEMTTRQDHRGSVACESGHGLFMNIITDDQVQGRTMYGHGGKANGMLCAAYFDPTDRTGVVMLTNGCNNKPVHNGVGMLGRQIMRVCYQELIDGTHQVEDPFTVTE